MLKMVKIQKRNQTWHMHISDWATYFPFIWRSLILEQQSSREFKTAYWACLKPYCLLYLYKDMLRCVSLNVHTCGYLNVWFKKKRKKKQKGKDLEVILSTMKQNWSPSTVFLPGSWCVQQHSPKQKPNHLHLMVGLISCKGLSRSFVNKKMNSNNDKKMYVCGGGGGGGYCSPEVSQWHSSEILLLDQVQEKRLSYFSILYYDSTLNY